MATSEGWQLMSLMSTWTLSHAMSFRGPSWDCLIFSLVIWIVGLSIPSESLQMTAPHSLVSKFWTEKMPSRRSLTGLKGGPVETSCS